MATLLEQAAQAHAAETSAATAAELSRCNETLKARMKAVLGVDCEPANNQFAIGRVTFTCHTDGKLHVLQTCPKCKASFRSFHEVKSFADLHRAITEQLRTHPPCNGAKALREKPTEEPAP